jgi:hypothetical protein
LHSALDKKVVVAALQAEFDIVVLTTYLPVTFDKLCSMTEKDVHVTIMRKLINRVSLAGQDFFASTLAGHSLKVSTGAENPSQASKDVFC